ncbi:MFS domain-containing protein [Aphelenchoides fujianensis]|nr:MFS domain-containing protein [Aphelenchoides fujianensis]
MADEKKRPVEEGKPAAVNLNDFTQFGVYSVFFCIAYEISLIPEVCNLLLMVYAGFAPRLVACGPNDLRNLSTVEACAALGPLQNETKCIPQLETQFESLAFEFGYYCDAMLKVKQSISALILGALFGALLFGQLSDHFGRKKMLLVSHVGMFVFNFMASRSSSLSEFTIVQFLSMFAAGGHSAITHVFLMENQPKFAENAEVANRLATVFPRICRRGVDDVDERVRLRAVELLNCFQSHGTFKMSTLVSTSDLLDRLAFEEDEAVGSRLSEFLFHFFFDSCVSNVVRCNAVLHLCRQNREAALNLHRRLVDFLPLEEISLHLNAVLNLATCVLKEIEERGLDQEAGGHVGSSKSNGVHPTKAESFVQCGMEPEAEEEDEELRWSSVANAFQKVKDILDCSIVAYVCLYETAMESKESATLSALCQRFLQVVNWAVDRYEDLDESFMKTVFTIASLVKVKGIVSSRIQTTAERLLRAGDVNEQFLLILGSHDMSGLLQLLEEGLDQLLESSTKFEKNHSTTAAKRKRVRGFADETAVVDALDLVLASPVCSQQIRAEFLPFVEKFANKTERIRDNFMLRFRKDFDIDKRLFLRVHETFNVLNILRFVEPEKTAGTSNGLSLSPIRKRKHSAISRWPFTLQRDPLVAECEWFRRHFEAKPEICEDLPFMEKVLTALGRHLRAYKHTKGAVDQANRLLDVIEDEFMKIRLKSSLKMVAECRAHAEHAAEFALEDEEEADASNGSLPVQNGRHKRAKQNGHVKTDRLSPEL